SRRGQEWIATSTRRPLAAARAPTLSAGRTRAAGGPTSPTCPATKTARTARPWGSSCGASATAPASATSSTRSAPDVPELVKADRRRWLAGAVPPDPRRRADRDGRHLTGRPDRPVRLDAVGPRHLEGLLGRLRARAPLPGLLVARRRQPRVRRP